MRDGWEVHLYMINPSLHSFGVWTVGYTKQFKSYVSYVEGLATSSLQSSPSFVSSWQAKNKTNPTPTYP